MGRATTVFVIALLCLALLPGAAAAAGPTFTPGASGAGDPYYPLDGNGGYDVKHYDLDLTLRPATGRPRRHRDDRCARDAEPVAVRPRPRRPERPLRQDRRPERRLDAGRPGAGDHAEPRASSRAPASPW